MANVALHINDRIRQEIHAGAWCPKSSVSETVVEWLEIDLRSTHVITAVETQGRYGTGLGREYAEFFRITYMRPGFTDWRPYTDREENQVLLSCISILVFFNVCCVGLIVREVKFL